MYCFVLLSIEVYGQRGLFISRKERERAETQICKSDVGLSKHMSRLNIAILLCVTEKTLSHIVRRTSLDARNYKKVLFSKDQKVSGTMKKHLNQAFCTKKIHNTNCTIC